jgi:EmrB/QacA subfamily drug resistance transporter
VSLTVGAPGRPRVALGLLCAVQFMLVLDASIVSVALPSIQADLGADATSLQLVVSLYALAFGGGLILAGRAADRHGRRRLFLAGVATFTLASLTCGLAQSNAVLLAGRALQGAGAAMASPAALALLGELFADARRQARAFALWGALSAAGGAAGLLLGGVLTDAAGWPWVFLINLPAGAAVLIAAPQILDERRAPDAPREELTGALALTSGLGLLVLALSLITEHGAVGAAALVAGGLALAGFARVERRAARPVLDLRLLRMPRVGAANVGGFALSALIAGQSLLGTLYLQRVLGLSALETGLAVLPVTLVAFASSRHAPVLVERHGFARVLAGGLLVAGAGIGLLAGIGSDSSYWIAVLPGFVLFGAGLGTAFVAFTIGATADAPSALRGLASGLAGTSQQIGFALGAAALAALAAARTGGGADAAALVAGYRLAFACAAALAVAGAALVIWLARPRSTEPAASAPALP